MPSRRRFGSYRQVTSRANRRGRGGGTHHPGRPVSCRRHGCPDLPKCGHVRVVRHVARSRFAVAVALSCALVRARAALACAGHGAGSERHICWDRGDGRWVAGDLQLQLERLRRTATCEVVLAPRRALVLAKRTRTQHANLPVHHRLVNSESRPQSYRRAARSYCEGVCEPVGRDH